MARQPVNVGSSPDDKTGDPLQVAFNKLNANDAELYATSSGGFTASSTPPAMPASGAHWYDLSTGVLSIWINDGNSQQWVQVSPTTGSVDVSALFAPGTTMLFKQASAPLGWTKLTVDDDKAIRIVSGTPGNGGSVPFSSMFSRTATDGFTLSTDEMPSHAHGVSDPTHAHSISDPGHGHGLGDPGHAHGVADPTHAHTGQGVAWYQSFGTNGGDQTYSIPVLGDVGTAGAYTGIGIYGAGTGMWVGAAGTGIGIYGAYTGIGVNAAGGGAAHSHGLDMRLQYVDVIVASKN